MKIQPFVRITILLSTTFFFSSCLPDGNSSTGASEPIPESLTGMVTLATTGTQIAARGHAAESGGWLVAEIRQASHHLTFRDSAVWNGSVAISLLFPSIPEGTGYQAVMTYRDPTGLVTHSDTVANLAVVRASNTQAAFRMHALLGRLQMTVATAPTTIDTLSITWESGNRLRSAKSVRGPSGRTLLRLDSLPVGSTGFLHIRAWNTLGDTLYFADTASSILSQADQALTIRLGDSRGQISLSINFLPGGETDAIVLFPGDPTPNGFLVFTAFSDSSSSDWIGLENRSSDSVIGPVRIVRGTESFTVDLRLAPGQGNVLTKAACEVVDRPTHPLHGVPGVVCGLSNLSVSWSSTGTLWEIHTPDGALGEQIVVLDGKLGWPDLNTSTARTVRRKAGVSLVDATAGRSWCADSLDSPNATACQ